MRRRADVKYRGAEKTESNQQVAKAEEIRINLILKRARPGAGMVRLHEYSQL